MAEFDRYSESFDNSVEKAVEFVGRKPDFFMRAKVEHMSQLVQRRYRAFAGLRLLDAGCGVGRTDALLKDWQCDIVGVDVSANMVDVARRNNPWASYSVFDGENLPFADETFDIVFTICVFHHVDFPKRKSLAREFARVLRPGGMFLIYEHNPVNPLTRLTVLRCEFDKDARLLFRREAEALLKHAGCEDVHTDFILLLPFSSPLAAITEGLFKKMPFGAQYCAYGTKGGPTQPEEVGR